MYEHLNIGAKTLPIRRNYYCFTEVPDSVQNTCYVEEMRDKVVLKFIGAYQKVGGIHILEKHLHFVLY